MSKLAEFDAETNPLRRNRLLFDWLRDDEERCTLYDELRQAGFPILRFKSQLRSANSTDWPNQDVYLFSGRDDVEAALRYYSVEPYRALDSRFILGIDDPTAHDAQNLRARRALEFTLLEVADCARAAFDRAAVLPLKHDNFDLPNLGQLAAIHFVELLFGFRDEAQIYVQRVAVAAYIRLCFQIIGRHFVPDSGLPPANSPDAEIVKQGIREEIKRAADERTTRRDGEPERPVIRRLVDVYGTAEDEELISVVLGLIAGTVGNITAAVSIAIDDFFTAPPTNPTVARINQARDAALDATGGETGLLVSMISEALVRNPPATFLARTSRPWFAGWGGPAPTFRDGNGRSLTVPPDAHVLLAMGADADPERVFGGLDDPAHPHNCIGRHLAWPLILEAVKRVLSLPGLGRQIDRISGQPAKLKKRWGVICEGYGLRYQSDRRLNQHPLFVVLPIKEPVAVNAEKLKELTAGGAHIVERALRESRFVHFAHFQLIENETHLAFATVYDGDFRTYVEHFALQVPLFDEQFKYLAVDQPTPIRDYPKQFVENIFRYNRKPLADYFFSAYPTLTVADIANATGEVP